MTRTDLRLARSGVFECPHGCGQHSYKIFRFPDGRHAVAFKCPRERERTGIYVVRPEKDLTEQLSHRLSVQGV